MQAGGLFELAGLLARYRATCPGIGLKFQQASSAWLGRLLRSGAVDMILSTVFVERSPDVVSRQPVRSPLVVVCKTDSALGRQSTIALAALSDRERGASRAGGR